MSTPNQPDESRKRGQRRATTARQHEFKFPQVREVADRVADLSPRERVALSLLLRADPGTDG